MAVRVHEVHPTLVHFPLALLPVAFIADLAGRLMGNAGWMNLGKRLMPVAAVSGVVTAATGLAAQEAVEVGTAHDLLVTHRNLNAGLVGLVGVLAYLRARETKPGAGYLLATAGAVIGMSYTAYLGGKMVYDHGVGVATAGGVRNEASPEIRAAQLQEVAQTTMSNIGHAATHAVHHLREGSIAPALRRP